MPSRKPEEKIPFKVRKNVKMLQHQDWTVRLGAATALGGIGNASAVLPLAELLQDSSATVQTSAAQALGKIGHESAIPHLVKKVQSFHPIIGIRPHPWQMQASIDAAKALILIGRSIQEKEVKSKEGKALQLVAEHFHESEEPEIILKAYHAALAGKVTPKNARLYLKQLRAMKGKVK